MNQSPKPRVTGTSFFATIITRQSRLARLFCASLLICSAMQTHALEWSGLSSVTNGWLDASNWLPSQVPTASDAVIFTNAGSTNVQGAINNTVNANFTLPKLNYSGLVSNAAEAFNYHTTYIEAGTTLTVKSPNTTFMYVGTGADNGLGATNYSTILGPGQLVLGDPASPATYVNGFLQVKQASVTSGNHRATLDMAGLDNFVFAAGKFLVAANGTFGGAGDRVQGTVILAKTNVITCLAPIVTDPSEYLNEQPFTIGQSQGSQSAATFVNFVTLGQENTINADYLRIGGLKMNGTINFRAGLNNPTLKLRAADGTNRLPQIVLGDHTPARVASFNSKGVLDLGLGTVDAIVGDVYLGKNGWRDVAGDNTGGAAGTLTLGAGTFDVTTLHIGNQQGNNAGPSTGTVTVRTNASLIAGTINIGRDAGDAVGRGIGTLNINGGLVTVSGDIAEKTITGGSGASTLTVTNGGILNMMPAGDNVPGNITVDKLNVGIGTLTNYNTLGLSNLVVLAPATEFTIAPGQGLAPYAPGVPGTLSVVGSLTLDNSRLRFDLNDPSTANNDMIAVSSALILTGTNTVEISAASGTIVAGTYTLMTYGTLAGDASNLQVSGALADSRYSFAFDASIVPNVNLTVSGAPPVNLVWAGDGLANLWNQNSATNWNGNTEKFYALDTVTFDDTSTNLSVNVAGTVMPGSITVNSTNNYTLVGSGKISGSGGLINNGAGTLTISSANDYTGDTVINSGVVLVNGSLGNTAVTVNNGATLGGSGTILGTVTLQGGSTFAPGNTGIGTLAISNNLVLADGSATVFEANLDTLAHDKVDGLKTVTYGGTLNLVLSGRAVNINDTFKLFTATTIANFYSSPYSGAFSSIVPTTPGPYLAWDTSTLAKDGTLRVSSTAPGIAVLVTGNNITLSWPSSSIGWRLQAQTNAVGAGIGTNWVDVADSATTDHVDVTVNPANGSVFYRMINP